VSPLFALGGERAGPCGPTAWSIPNPNPNPTFVVDDGQTELPQPFYVTNEGI